MNILVDIGHPAHVHLMKYTIKELVAKGHKVTISTKDVPIIKRLLEKEGFNYINLGKKGQGLFEKMLFQLKFYARMLRIIKKERIDIGTGTSMSIPLLSKLSRMKSINMDDDDDEVQSISVRFVHPFSDVRLTPDAILGHRKSKAALFYAGCHELAYLHPKRFVPDESVLARCGLKKGDVFFIMRFVAFQAYHDNGQYGLSKDQKKQIVELLSKYGRVIITSERELDPDFEPYRLPVPPEEIHSLMAYSSLFVGDSQTMTSEAAILGVPAVKCNTFAGVLSVPNELEYKYGLCYSYQPAEFDRFYERIQSLIESPDTHKEWEKKRERFLNDKIDVTAFFTWFIENYPESKTIMQNNPEYQLRFR